MQFERALSYEELHDFGILYERMTQYEEWAQEAYDSSDFKQCDKWCEEAEKINEYMQEQFGAYVEFTPADGLYGGLIE